MQSFQFVCLYVFLLSTHVVLSTNPACKDVDFYYGFRPIHYDIELTLNEFQPIYRGRVKIDLILDADMDVIKLPRGDVDFVSAKLTKDDDDDIQINLNEFTPHGYRSPDDFPRMIPFVHVPPTSRNWTLIIDFVSRQNKGFHPTTYWNPVYREDTHYFISSYGGSHQAFPVYDDSKFRATMNIKVRNIQKPFYGYTSSGR